MQRPFEVLEDGTKEINSEVLEKQLINLTSAFAYSALVTKDGESEHKLYENIVEIPTYE